MLALLAIFILQPSRILPQPFLSTDLEPLLPVPRLEGVPRQSVTRSGSWRPGGLVRTTYYYFFPKSDAPELEVIKREGGFVEDVPAVSPGPGPRIARVRDGIRQVVWIRPIAVGETWKWANLTGPGQVVGVSDIPIEEGPRPRWHKIAEFESPTIPPGFPNGWHELASMPVIAVDTEAIIPRFQRSSYWILVRLGSQQEREPLFNDAQRSFSGPEWQALRGGPRSVLSRVRGEYGLTNVEVRDGLAHQPFKSIVTLTYLFRDNENSPRIVD